MRVVTEGLNFPTSLTFGEDGTFYVAESDLPFGGAPVGGKVWRIDSARERTYLLSDLRPPVNGVVYHEGGLIVSEGGYPGRISRLDLASGEVTTLIDDLPGFGNYQTNMVAIGPDGKLYSSQGALTNSGIIGLDSHDLGWLRHVPHNCDLPGYDVVLNDVTAVTRDPRSEDQSCPWSLFKTNPRTVGSQQRATHADTSVAIAFRIVGVVVTRLPQRSKGTSTSKRSV